MTCFEKVRQRLREWAMRVKDARGEIIANITTDTIKDLCGERYFSLPDKFEKYIDEFRIKEGALQSIADYRDHFIHPFHVFIIGYYILDQAREMGIKQLKLIEDDENINLKAWFISSIYHDVGYPADKFEDLVRDFFEKCVGRQMSSQFDWSTVLLADDNIMHIDKLSSLFAKRFGDQHQAMIFEKWFHKRLLEEHDHGVLAALMLCNQGWEEEELNRFVYDAALAIALHSWERSTGKTFAEFNLGSLAIEKFPLAFFLTYCDYSQEWGRRVLLELKKHEAVPIDVTAPDTRLEDIVVSQSETKVTLKYSKLATELITEDKSLDQLFHDFGNKFQSTWHFEDNATPKFIIEGKDNDNFPIGAVAPRRLQSTKKINK